MSCFCLFVLLFFSVNSFSASYYKDQGITYEKGMNYAIVTAIDDTVTVANILHVVSNLKVISIGACAFDNCKSLVRIEIPNTITSIVGNWARCSSLTQINVDNGNTAFSSIEGVLFNKAQTKLFIMPSCGTRSVYEIPNTVTSISGLAFYNCKFLTRIVIPNSVTSIGNSAFSGCSSLTQIEIPNLITIIGDYTFSGCTALSRVEIPKSIFQIGSNAFEGCISLTEIEIPCFVMSIGSAAFKGCKSLTQISVDTENINYSSVDGALFDKMQTRIIFVPACKTGIYIIPKSVTTIGGYAFSGCESLTQIEIPNWVTSIESFAFEGCSALSQMSLPNSITFIGGCAFYNCKKLKAIAIPSVQTIEKNILLGCSNLAYVFSYATIEKYEYNPFKDVSSLATIFCPKAYIATYKKGRLGPVVDIETYILNISTTQGKISFKTSNKYNNMAIEQAYMLSIDNDTIYAEKKGEFHELKNLMPGKKYNIGINLRAFDCDLMIFPSLSTKAIGLVCNSYTQTKLNLNIEADDVLVSESFLKYRAVGEWEWKYLDNVASSEITLSGLIPGMTYECYASVCINNNWYLSITGYNYQKFATRKLSLNISKPVIGQTVFSCSATFTAGDATVEGYGFTGAGANGEYDNTTELKSTGLDPNTEYKVVFRIKTKEGGVTSTGYTFTTLPILLTTLPADACSYVTATIHANMNCDAESGTGFEWRKMDAPNIVPSNFVEAPIVNEKMAFSLRNLTPSTYYKYRPYYKSNSGKYCYGEWIGFSTADVFVLYTPTVETLKVAAVEGNTATFHGYVIAGSEDILQQGFEYWKADNNGYIRNSEVYKTVLASGLKMVAAAEGLDYNSTYYYRAFAKTASGITYGEEMNFKTEEITGLEDITGTDAFNVALRSNPVYRQAWIRINGKNEHATYYLINLNGSMVDSGEIIADDSWQVIDLSHRTSGIYLLRINNERHSKTLKLIIK